MPRSFIFHERNIFSFDRLRDDRCRFSFSLLCFFKCRCDLVKVMSVNIDHMEVKCIKLLVDRVWRIDICNISIDLKSIVVYDHNSSYLIFYVLQAWLLPTPALPGSLRLQEVCIHDNHLRKALLRSPFQLLLRFPVREIRLTYLHQECASCPDVPGDKIPHDEVLSDLLPGRILCLQVSHNIPVLCDLSIRQNGLCLPFFGSAGSTFISSKKRYV